MSNYINCSRCGTRIEPDFKFCKECGTKVITSLSDSNAGDQKGPEITIEFGYSTSSRFEFAVECAQKNPTFHAEKEGKAATYKVTYTYQDEQSVNELMELVEHLENLRNKRVYVDGQKMPWPEVFHWVWNYRQRQAAYIPALYCFGEEEWNFNLWGCNRLNMPFAGSSRWLCYGSFDDNLNFRLDKDRIRHEALREAHKVRFCPALNLDFILRVIEALPEKINPKKDRDWDFQEDYGGLGESVTVTVKEYGYTTEKRVIGVQPRSLKAAKKIFEKIPKVLMPPEIVV